MSEGERARLLAGCIGQISLRHGDIRIVADTLAPEPQISKHNHYETGLYLYTATMDFKAVTA